LNAVDIPEPPKKRLSPTNVAISPIPKLSILKVIEPGDWEDFTLELATEWKKQFSHVVRCGGAGDMGRDVIAYTSKQHEVWENFQCKRYSGSPISVADAVIEIAKIAYYTFQDEYTVPVKYYFVSPQGISVKLLNLIHNPDKLMNEVIERWEKSCSTKITSLKKILLTNDLQAHIEAFDFSIFDYIPPIKLIEFHENTVYHIPRFGASFPERPKAEEPKSTIEDNELVYTRELLQAFSDHEKVEISNHNLKDYSKYEKEFSSARRCFYSAENLERFSRDWLKDDSYSLLSEECMDAISPVVNNEHESGYKRYLATLTHATTVNYAHALNPYIEIKDKKGMCHQLVNIREFKWVGYE